MRPKTTVGKRVREKDRVERQQLKEERRKLRKLERVDRAEASSGEEDPDLAGIVPGPQKLDPVLFGLVGSTDPTLDE